MVLHPYKKKTFQTTKVVNTSGTAGLFSRIQQRAYNLYERRGYNTGNDWADWFEAECQVKKELGIR